MGEYMGRWVDGQVDRWMTAARKMEGGREAGRE